ncbi:tyrosine-protein kinase Etk/Wzc [Meinhardsimonia xiamenensis]|uniref:Tyrosine-protein kinase Etk/Wzc n=1 Tax=Meinhardsimonia xiamenensis TaxID=990712 RepID=A0A1G9HDA1_9RHOB|nr:polysaccharide biosynthesis tyrosine autokinase [Meinhardsimonia xiamenensis]PRX28375.1 tyrosine-protein kinase Etk/Wzc [Meinhardsimonia xiamenensis]SDL11028.1 tyrosine-protein kinase Etk/Wzc [Meinhardsimonia xiamenensis]
MKPDATTAKDGPETVEDSPLIDKPLKRPREAGARLSPEPAPARPVPPAPEDDEIDLLELFGTLWRGKLWIALVTALGLLASGFYILNTPPTYQADALIQLEEKSGALALPSSLASLMSEEPRSATEIEILKSRMVLGQGVERSHFDWRVEPLRVPLVGTALSRFRLPVLDGLIPARFVRAGEGLRLADLSVPPRWQGEEMALTVTGQGSFTLALPDGRALEGRVGAPASDEETGLTLTVAEIAAEPGRVFLLSQVGMLDAIDELRKEWLSVSERGRGSGILEARLTGPDRARNVEVLDAIVKAYVEQNILRSAAEAEKSLEFIRSQLPGALLALRRAEAALDAFREKNATVGTETKALSDEINRLEARLAALDDAAAAAPEERARLEARLAELKAELGAQHKAERELASLTRNVDLAQRAYVELLTRAKDVEMLKASAIGNVRIVDEPAATPEPVAPKVPLILALGMLLGGMLGSGGVLVRNWMRHGVRDAADIERMGLPVFATVNYSRKGDTGGARRGQLPVVALTDPHELAVEGIRSLRTSLHFGMLDAPTPTVTITSPHPGAGKSFIAANLAVVAAQAGQRVCLIDADLRRGQLHRFFDAPKEQLGLTEILAGDARPEETLIAGPVEGLSIIETGRYPPNPSELLMRPTLGELVAWCAENHDLAIFDAPPVLAVTDPVILGRVTGATLMVARHDVTPLQEVEAAIRAFESAGVPLTGAVLSGFDPKKARSRYGYGYRYAYGKRKEE